MCIVWMWKLSSVYMAEKFGCTSRALYTYIFLYRERLVLYNCCYIVLQHLYVRYVMLYFLLLIPKISQKWYNSTRKIQIIRRIGCWMRYGCDIAGGCWVCVGYFFVFLFFYFLRRFSQRIEKGLYTIEFSLKRIFKYKIFRKSTREMVWI